VSEQEKITSSEEDVEAHKRRAALNEEPRTEGEIDDDVEAHKKKSVQASEEPKAEGESDDDVELHRRKSVL
jgi:hypothetical protein